MVTEFAKEMIKNADSCGAQDIYVIPRQDKLRALYASWPGEEIN